MRTSTEDFKNKAEKLIGGKIQQFHITKANNMVTDEQAQEAFLDVLRKVKNGECIISNGWPDNTPKKTISEIIGELE